MFEQHSLLVSDVLIPTIRMEELREERGEREETKGGRKAKGEVEDVTLILNISFEMPETYKDLGSLTMIPSPCLATTVLYAYYKKLPQRNKWIKKK